MLSLFSSIQKLCSFAKALTKAIVFWIDMPCGMGVCNIAHHPQAYQRHIQHEFEAANGKNCSHPLDPVKHWYTVLQEMVHSGTLSPKRKSPGARRPSYSNRAHSLLSSKAMQSEEDPTYKIEISKKRPQQSDTAWQFSPNLFFLPQKNFFLPTPHFAASISLGFEIQMRIPSMALAQEEKPIVLA
jgi:hypothetical protein